MLDKTILLTGGTGSFGQKFTEIALTLNPKAIRVFSRGEFLQSEMQKRFHDERLRFFIGDVRDRDRLRRAAKGADIIVHAAALKQVPAAEYNPIEAVKTNIDGAVNVIDAALDSGVERVLALSTDKAVHPVNLYGATKMVMEKLFVQANVYGGKFSCVRYGNVIGSRGSVIPLFREQAASGVLTVTDPRMTRFWISLEQGVRFVIDCLERMKGGEVFIPKIPSAKITDMAHVIAPECTWEVTGIRQGEKLHEVLVAEDEHAVDIGSAYVIEQGTNNHDGCFRYSSDGEEWLMTEDEIRGLL